MKKQVFGALAAFVMTATVLVGYAATSSDARTSETITDCGGNHHLWCVDMTVYTYYSSSPYPQFWHRPAFNIGRANSDHGYSSCPRDKGGNRRQYTWYMRQRADKRWYTTTQGLDYSREDRFDGAKARSSGWAIGNGDTVCQSGSATVQHLAD